MTLPDVPTFLAGISLTSLLSVLGCLGIGALLNTLLTKLLERRTDRLKDGRNAVEREKDRQHEAKKWQHEAQERDKDRKHEKALNLINAQVRSTSSSSVMAVA